MLYRTVYNLSFNGNCRILAAELNCTFTNLSICKKYTKKKIKISYLIINLTEPKILQRIYLILKLFLTQKLTRCDCQKHIAFLNSV